MDISNQLYQPLYKICQNQTTDFAFFYGYHMYENSPTPTTDFYRVLGTKKDNNCRTEFIERIADNNTLILEGPGVNVLSYELKPAANSFPAYWVAKAQFNSTGSPTISWKVRVNYTANDCGYESTETLYRGTYRKIFSIPKPPTPTLTALKAVVKAGESTTIVCSDCPNTLAGEAQYPYSNGSVDAAFSLQCGPDGQPDFNYSVIHYYGPPYALPFDGRQTFYKPGAVFYARCNDNGCLSDISGPAGVSIQATPPSCGDPKMNEIDNYTFDGRPDYHYYTTETVVCNKSGDPNCTQANVFKLLKSSKVFAAPAAIDFTPVNPGLSGTAFGQLSTKLSLLGSKLIFNENQSPVSNCETANLAGPAGLLLNFLAMTKGVGAYVLSYEATAGTPVANPVTQFIDEPTFSVTNYTQKWHILYPGKTTRIVVDACDKIKIITIGTGRSWLGDLGLFDTARILKELNIFSGKNILFPNADARLKQAYTESYK